MKRGISAGSSQSIAGADSAFCLHYKKLPCQTRLAGRILPFCWGRKGESDPPRGAGDLRLHWGKKASQTRLSGRTRELGLSVNAVNGDSASVYLVPCTLCSLLPKSPLGTITESLMSHGESGWCDELMFWNGFFELVFSVTSTVDWGRLFQSLIVSGKNDWAKGVDVQLVRLNCLLWVRLLLWGLVWM